MEEKKTIFDYLGQVFMIYGITIVILNIFCLLFGESAKEYSSMFSLGGEGLGLNTMMQFLLVSACTVAIKSLFFTDKLIKNMTIAVRTICMVVSEILIIAVFILTCGWFPADMWLPWIMFFVCFCICFIVSVTISVLKERLENKKMEEALGRIKRQERAEE